MTVNQGIFGDKSNFDDRFVPDYGRLAEMSMALKGLGASVVLTSGSFDLVHEGHALYLEAAKSFGSLLIVGVDSDIKIRERKGPDRPIVPEMERLRMLTHFRPVDIVTLKPPGDTKWELIKVIRPDVLIATVETYSDDDIAELEGNYCGRVQVMERMATTTTSARLRELNMSLAERFTLAVNQALPGIVSNVLEPKGQTNV